MSKRASSDRYRNVGRYEYADLTSYVGGKSFASSMQKRSLGPMKQRQCHAVK